MVYVQLAIQVVTILLHINFAAGAFLPVQLQTSPPILQKDRFYAIKVDDETDGEIIIQQIDLGDKNELMRMSKFCIEAFYRNNEEEEGGPPLST